MKMQGEFFKKTFIFYFSFTVIILALISQIIYSYTSKIIEREVKKNSQYLLKQAEIYTEEKIMGDIYSIINSNFINIPKEDYISDFFEDDMAIEDYFLITTKIKELIQEKDYITNMGLYNGKKDHYISLNNGLVLSPSSMTYKIHDFDLLHIKSYLSTHHNNHLENTYKRRGHFIYNESLDSTTIYLQPLPLFGKNEPVDFLVLFIDPRADSITKNMEQILDQGKSSFFILNTDLQLLQGNENKNLDFIKELPLEETSFTKVNTVEGKFLVTWIKSPVTDWYYIFQEPYDSFIRYINGLRWFVALIILVFLVFAFVGIILITKRLYKPVDQLVHIAEKLAPGKYVSHNEFDFINTTLGHMDLQVRDMLVKNHSLMEYKTLTDFFLGTITSNELEERLNLLQLNVTQPQFSLLLIEIPEEVCLSMEYLDLQLTLEEIREQVITSFKLEPSLLCLNNPYNQMIYVLNHGYSQEELRQRLLILEESIEELPIHFFGILSESYDHISHLHRAYRKSKKLLQYKFFYGKSKLMCIQSINAMMNRHYDYEESHKVLEELLKSKNYDKAMNTIQLHFNNFREIGYAHEHIKKYIDYTMKSILLCLNEQACTYNDFTKDENFTHFTINDYEHQLLKWLQILHQQHQQRYDGAELEFIAHLLDFIDTHVDADLSLQVLSNNFGMSQSHLSKIFKKHKGLNISKYILDKKLTTAAEQIIQCPHKDIQSIAAELGYYTPSYFSKLFKQKYGITPGKYRLENARAIS